MISLRFAKTALLVAALLFAPPALTAARAESQGVVAIVNDQPVTERDIAERISLLTILGDAGNGTMSRKAALQSLIDEQIKVSEATKFKQMPTDNDLKEQIARMAKGMDSTTEGLIGRLKKQGVSEKAFKTYVGSMIGFNRVLSGKFRGEISVTDAEVDAKMAEIKSKLNGQVAKIMNDPRMKGVTVYSLMEIILPVEGNDSMLMQARAIDAQQVLQRFKGCGNVRAAAEGVFNVKQGKKFDADGSKLPKAMKSALDKVGVGRAIGPMRGKGGIQLLAFCGTRKITPQKPDFTMPTRDQVERMVRNDKFDGLEEQYLKSVRGNVYVEYRNSSYAPQ